MRGRRYVSFPMILGNLEKIVIFMKENSDITILSLAKKLDISTRAIEKQIAKLKQQGKNKRIGLDKGGYWEVVNWQFEVANCDLEYRQKRKIVQKKEVARNRDYKKWLKASKDKYRLVQFKAAAAVNSQLLNFYWGLGGEIVEKQKETKWGDSLIQNSAFEIQH